MSGAASGALPDLSILLLTRNAGERFREVLDALFACRGIERAEVLVVDSGSSDATVELARSRPGVQVHRIAPEEFGHGRTRNLAASLARAPILVFLVQDATPAGPELLEELIAPLQRDPRVAGAYGRQIARADADPVEAAFLRHTYPEPPEERRLEEPGRPVTLGSIFFSNVCSAIRREAWERFPFDETLVMSEDQRWAREVLAAGHRIAYRPSATVRHSHRYGLGHLLRRNFDSGHSLVGVAEDRWHELVGRELRFLGWAAAGLWRRRERRWLPWLLLHEAARSLGFALGRHARWLPSGLRRRLSLQDRHWPDADR